MSVSFEAHDPLQNDQTSLVQNTDGDTDVPLSDASLATLLAAVDAAVLAGEFSAHTAFAEDVAGAYKAGVMTITGDGDLSDIKFTDADGAALNGDPSGLKTASGFDILLYSSPDGQIVYGVYDDGTGDQIAFAVQMQVTVSGGTASVDLATVSYAPLESPTPGEPDETVDLGDYLHISARDDQSFDFSALASTKFLFGVVGSTDGGFLVIGKDPAIEADGTPSTGGDTGDLINSSQGGGAVTIGLANQQFTGDADPTTAEEGAYFTYVTGLAAGTYDDADDIAPSTYVEVETARLQVSQVQGNNEDGMRLTALNYDGAADGQAYVGELTAASDAHGASVSFLSIRVYNADGTDVTVTQAQLESGTQTLGDLTFSLNADGSVDIVGLDAKDWIEWTTDAPHDRILVEALSGKWDIGAFEIEQVNTATTAIGGLVRFGDDAPTVDLVLDGEAQLVLDESTGADLGDPNAEDGAPLAQQSIAAADYLSAGTASFGTDGAGAEATDDVWTLSTAEGADSGLVAVASGLGVYLFLEDGAIVGREGADASAAETGDEVLRFAIDAETGTVTVTQSLALTHPDDTEPDDAVGLTGAGLVVVTRTMTDADDDPDSDTADLTGIFAFEDDAPTVATSGEAPTLFTADSDFATDDSESFAALFTADYGEDDKAAVDDLVFTLGIKTPGGESGLTDTGTGEAIRLDMDGDTVIGYVGDDPALIAFVISVDAEGVVKLDQRRAVVHDDIEDDEEIDESAATLSAADLVTLTVTATDGDGDQASETRDIGLSFAFGDDGPDVTRTEEELSPVVTDDSTLGSAGPVDLSVLFAVDDGNDGPGDATEYRLGVEDGADTLLTDAQTGSRILLRLDDDGNVEGYLEDNPTERAFTITLDQATGEATLSQLRAITHDDPADGFETGDDAEGMAADLITVTARATDGDGDYDEETAGIGDLFRFEDDAPDVTRSTTAVPDLVTDDTDLPGDTSSASFKDLFDVDPGNDGAGETADLYALGISETGAQTALFDTATGSEILLRMNGEVVEGYLADETGTNAFTISVDGDGEVTLTQLRAIQHGDPEDPAETFADGNARTLAADLVTLSLTSYDGDEDSDTETINIGDAFHFEDDGPDVTLAAGTLPEMIVGDATLGSAGPEPFDDFFDVDHGKDGAAAAGGTAFSLSVASNGVDSGLVDAVSGDAILLRMNGGIVEGYLEGDTDELAFTVAIDAAGQITLDQVRAIEHNDPDDPDETGVSAAKMVTPDLIVLTATAIDGDGDQDSEDLDITGVFRFTDDGPGLEPLEDLMVDIPGSGGTQTDSAVLDFDTGNDGYGDIKITDFEVSLLVNGKTLTGVLNTAGTLLTYFQDANTNGAIDNGETAFTYELKDLLGSDGLSGTDGQLDTAVFAVTSIPTIPSLDYNFRDLPAGQNGFGILAGRSAGATLPDPNSPSILIVGDNSAYNPDGTYANGSATVNTSKGGGPTTIGVSNQMVDPNEGVWFSYLTNPDDRFVAGVTGGLSQSEADDYDNIQFAGGLTEVTEAFFKIVQVQGNPKIAKIELNAYDVIETPELQGRALVDMLKAIGDATAPDAAYDQVTITSVTIGTNTYDRAENEGSGVLVWEGDGGVTLLKAVANDTIVFETDRAHDAALITGATGKFDIGDYGIDQTYDAPDTQLDVTLTLTDGDGDWTSEIQSLLIDGSGVFNDDLLT